MCVLTRSEEMKGNALIKAPGYAVWVDKDSNESSQAKGCEVSSRTEVMISQGGYFESVRLRNSDIM